MLSSPLAGVPASSPAHGPELEVALHLVEQRLAALGDALLAQDADAVEREAGELHRALAAAVNRFAQAARRGGVPPDLRERLALAGGKVAARRESLARATASLDRAIDVLLPGMATPAGYGASGAAERGSRGGMLQA